MVGVSHPAKVPVPYNRTESRKDAIMSNLNPLKYCFHGQHSKLRKGFRTLPGANTREVCADCYAWIMADRKQKKNIPVPG